MRIVQVMAAAFAVQLLLCVDARAGGQLDEPRVARVAQKLPSQSANIPIIEELEFVGLRRIAPQAVLAQMATRAGQPFDTEQLADDVRKLGRLEWFATIRVVQIDKGADPDSLAHASPISRRIQLKFFLEERPFLVRVDYEGSRLFSRKQIEKFLVDEKKALKLGQPENPVMTWRAADAIKSELAALGHPDARVEVQRDLSEDRTVRVRFVIVDGPYLPVRHVNFNGDTGVSAKALCRQMERVKPSAFLAGLRGKNVFTQEAAAEDRQRLLTYFQDHGYPEARVGTAEASRVTQTSWSPWPVPHRTRHERLEVVVPVEAGPLYRLESLNVSKALREAAGSARAKSAQMRPGQPYSQRSIEMLRVVWQARVQPKVVPGKLDAPSWIGVQAHRNMDSNSHTVRIELARSDTPPYIVQSLEFRGMRRLPDRYLRRRIPLKEGEPLDDRALEEGFARLARTTYFKPVKKEDVRVKTDDVTHTARVTVHVEEVGQQRASLIGGRGQFGSTLGVAYTVFNLFHGEELLSSQLEGGPESLQFVLGFAKEGFLGSRGSLALSAFNIFLRPRFSGPTKGPFFKQESTGAGVTWSYTLTKADTLSINYDQSRSKTLYSPIVPENSNDLAPIDVRTETSSHAAGIGWTHVRSGERFSLFGSASGGWLGGSENLVRSKAEYERATRDPLFNQQNTWAFRTSFSGVGSYAGDLPFYARLFAGDDFVRGLSTGALGPQALVSTVSSDGQIKYSTSPAGSDLAGAASGEYRMRLNATTEGSAFFDIGSGMLLPNWLGRSRPALIDSTNRIIHASTGLQLQWTIPGVGVPVLAYYALNVLRLDRWLPMPDGSSFHARDPLSKFGWGLGPMF